MCAATLMLAGCGGGIESLDVLSASADGASDEDVTGFKKIGKPYKVGGRWYTPKHDEDYDKTGKASWYGPQFHGKSTANGEVFDQDSLTAAHPTLPLPSYVRVTVLKTGKSAVLRVNDRGPFHRGRIIDVSKGAATKLGFRAAGSAKVRVEYLGEAPVGGGDKETLVAESKFGKSSSKSLANYLFGSDDDDEEEGKVEVRLASAKPAGKDEQDARNNPLRAQPERSNDSNLPGVNLRSYKPAMLTASVQPSAVQAYQAEIRKESGGGGAVEAVIAMNEPVGSLEEEEIVPSTAAVATVSEETVAASQSRVTGAFDMFGAAPSDAAATAGGETTAALQGAGTSE
ncbi:septal ring lytic transglycosylase RlpA family protein [Acuticoccus sp. I52.16.1]|uniref:septal ring lytic transglycosylase RlpA family protein n=1 Tax=Acuticoccus sp. I52.16.1 TaxID=2928472 RepID=UPI001FD0BFE4|nr:septal ring lytic transglycosylase RlpA family protein [Acuticoccus sp. I52.16.1]UOM34573.1 septal ring lytic transglycosylase RlpA family protein [Acuticoccus sp. I52.16.1]